MTTYRVVSIVTAIAMTAASAINAQTGAAKPGLSVGVFGGISFPVGTLEGDLKSGYNIGATLELPTGVPSISIRGDVIWQHFDEERARLTSGTAGSRQFASRVLAGSLNGVVHPPSLRLGTLQPYVLTGVGVYDFFGNSSSLGPNQRQLGLNVGAGVRKHMAESIVWGEARFSNAPPARIASLSVGRSF